MLFLLRKIRRKLMQKNKFTTYLLYAIGEIVLVVIGILIAVSINNWNQERQDRATELSILNGLLIECAAAKEEIVTDTRERRKMVKRAEYLYKARQGQVKMNLDSARNIVSDLLNYRFYTPTHPILDDLSTSNRFELIQSDSVKTWIRYYIQDKDRVGVMESQELAHVETLMEPFLSQHLDLSKIIFGDTIEEQDVAFLMSNKQLGGLLHGRIDKTWSAIYFSGFLEDSIDRLSQALQAELETNTDPQ